MLGQWYLGPAPLPAPESCFLFQLTLGLGGLCCGHQPLLGLGALDPGSPWGRAGLASLPARRVCALLRGSDRSPRLTASAQRGSPKGQGALEPAWGRRPRAGSSPAMQSPGGGARKEPEAGMSGRGSPGVCGGPGPSVRCRRAGIPLLPLAVAESLSAGGGRPRLRAEALSRPRARAGHQGAREVAGRLGPRWSSVVTWRVQEAAPSFWVLGSSLLGAGPLSGEGRQRSGWWGFLWETWLWVLSLPACPRRLQGLCCPSTQGVLPPSAQPRAEVGDVARFPIAWCL